MEIKRISKLPSDWYEITVAREGKTETFKLSEDLLIEHQLFNKKQLDQSQYEQLKRLANYSKCYQQVLNYLSYRMRTEKEVRDYLTKKECPPDEREKIIKKLIGLKYIDDERFAEAYTKEQVYNKKGPVWIKNKLIQLGIDSRLATHAVESIPKETYNDQLLDSIKKLDHTNRKKPISKRKVSIVNTLLNRGYWLDDIQSVMSTYPFEAPDNEVALAQKEAQKALRRLQKKYEGYDLRERIIARLIQKGYSYSIIQEVLETVLKGES